MSRWRAATPIVALLLSLCGVATVLAMLKDEHHDHARVSTARALELLSPQQTDANLIGAAYFALSRDMEAAIAALKLRPDDAQAAALLAHWHLITGTR